MTKIFLLFLNLLLLTACFSQNKSKVKPAKVSKSFSFELDTVVERNNPKSLDLTKHQLYIDTTRTAEYYNQIEKWNPFEENQIDTKNALEELYQKQEIIEFDFQNFPRLWIPLRMYQNDYLLYDRCDGSETSYGLSDSFFYIFGVHEFDIRKIKRILKINTNELEIELDAYVTENKNKTLKVHFKATENKDIYHVTLDFDGYITQTFMTPPTNVRNFDVLINHCPENKVLEYRFEE